MLLRTFLTLHAATADPNHAKNVNCDAVDRLAREAAKAGCRRVVRVTGKGEAPWSFFSVLINLLGCHAKTWNYEGERRLRANEDIAYTIVRPGVMGVETELAPDSLALADDGGDLKVSAIPHAAVADLCVEVLGCVEIKKLRRVHSESPRRPPRHRRDACSMAWRCRFITTRQSQNGRVIVVK